MLFKNHPDHQARSAGTSDQARTKINERLLAWADVVFVMERRHKQLLKQRFPLIVPAKLLILLEIEDHYHYGDEELIGILKEKLHDYL
jgi:predicted protein tyrosine phosphatase